MTVYICFSRRVTVMSTQRCPERTWSGCLNRKVSQTTQHHGRGVTFSRLLMLLSRIYCIWIYLENKVIKCCCFVCRVSAGPGRHRPHTTTTTTGRGEARWHSDLWCDPWNPQVCSVSMGRPFGAGPRHPDLSRGGTRTAPHRAPCPPATDTALLRLHQMWQGVLGRLSLRPRALHVSGRLSHNRRGIGCSGSAELTDVELKNIRNVMKSN